MGGECKTCTESPESLDSTEPTESPTKVAKISPSAISNWKKFEEGSRYSEIIKLLRSNSESFIIFSEFVVALELLQNIINKKYSDIIQGRTVALYSGGF